MIESTALDFWRKSKKPEIESYIIDHDFRKIQVKNTASYWILPYIYKKKKTEILDIRTPGAGSQGVFLATIAMI